MVVHAVAGRQNSNTDSQFNSQEKLAIVTGTVTPLKRAKGDRSDHDDSYVRVKVKFHRLFPARDVLKDVTKGRHNLETGVHRTTS